MHDEYTKKIRRRIEEYLRKSDKKKIMALALILNIDMGPRPKKHDEDQDPINRPNHVIQV